jgi:outer membrane protein insertion porin family
MIRDPNTARIVFAGCSIFLLSFTLAPSEAQEVPQDSRYEVKKIEFEGNESLSDKLLRSVMSTKESPGKISSFFYNHISERLGSPREYFDPATLEADLLNLKALYRDHGFFSVVIDTTIRTDETEHEVEIDLTFQEGPRSLIESIRCLGIDSVSPAVRGEILSNEIPKVGSPFLAAELSQEQERVLGLFFNRGYPLARLDSTVVQRRLSTNNVAISLSFTPGREYTLGEIAIAGEEGSSTGVDREIVYRHLDIEPGQLYSLQRKLDSERNLSRLGIFENVRITTPFPPAGDTSHTLPVKLYLTLRKKHEMTPEVFVNDEDNAFNLGLGLGYNNRNFLGSARNFSTRARFRVQSIQQIKVLQMFTASGFRQPSLVANAELTFQLIQPYLFSNTVSGSWTFSLIADKRKPYLQSIVRNRMGINNQFSLHSYGFFEWNLERMGVEIFDSSSASRFTGEQRPQLNSILVATVQRDLTNDIFSPSSGFFLSLSFEEAGMLPALFRNFGSNLPFSQYYKVSAFGRWYADLSKDRFTIFASKMKIGFGEPYRFERNGTEDLPIPLNRRFFAGGSGSVRGWRTRDLGAVEVPQFGGNAIFESNFETRINILRGLGDLWFLSLNRVWTVFFLDFGNVWGRIGDFRVDQVGVASGFGFRYDTIFGPLRIDFGFRLYDPGEREGKRWFTEKRFWRDVFDNGVLHFGIGQAF